MGVLSRILLRDGVADLQARKVWRRGSVTRLSSAEVEVLGLLSAREGETVDRDEILVRALGHEATSLSRAVDLCVHRLRLKLEQEPARPVHLITSQGEGYRLMPATEIAEPWSNVPRPRGALVGREALVDRAAEALLVGPVTLVGPAGVGKTAVAQQVALSAARTRTPAGTFWVDAATVADPAALVQAIAQVAGVQTDTLEGLAAALEARGPSLVAIDTCERAVDAVAAVVAGLARACRLLLTSRIAVPGAGVIEVGPLSPAEAGALLVRRAREAGFDGLLPNDRVARVVDAVDRLPLGIELAAARLPAMSLSRIEHELERPLRLLRGRASGRQASVEASVRWSWDALSDADREHLVRLAVFKSAVPDEVAEALEGPDAVRRLVDAHLLRRTEDGLTTWHAVGELAQQLAAPEVWARAERAHADHVAQRARALVPALWTPAYEAALAELRRLEPDLAAAEPACPDPIDVVLARLELDHEESRFEAAVARVERALDGLPGDHPERAALLAASAAAAGKLGRYQEAVDRGEQALAVASRAEDRVAAAYTIAAAYIRGGKRDLAEAATARVWDLAGDDPVLLARAHGARVLLDTMQWPGSIGIARLEAALRAAEEAGLVRVIAIATHNLAVGYNRIGEVDRAIPMFERSTGLLVRNRRACGIAWYNLAILRIARDAEGSLQAAQAAVTAFSDCGAADFLRVSLTISALAHALLGEAVDALADADEANSVGDRSGSGPTTSRALRAAIYAYCGRREVAAALFAEIAPQMAEHLAITQPDADALVAAWIEDRPLPAEQAARWEEVSGDRRWLQVQALRYAGRIAPP